MIKTWKLYNFKAIAKAELDLSPLTLFAGANSSGKSSFLQSILLITQTLSSRVGTQTIVLNGHLTKLGQFDDLKRPGIDDPIRIAWDLAVPKEQFLESFTTYFMRRSSTDLESVSCDISFGIIPGGGRKAQQLNPKLFECNLSCLSNPEMEGTSTRSFIKLTRDLALAQSQIREDAQDKKSSRTIINVDFDIQIDDEAFADLKEELSSPHPFGSTFQHFLPQYLAVTFDQKEEITKALISVIVDPIRARQVTRHITPTEVKIPDEVVTVLKTRFPELGAALSAKNAQLALIDQSTEELTLANLIEHVRVFAPLRGRSKDPELVKELTSAAQSFPEKNGFTTVRVPGDVLDDAIDFTTAYFTRSVRYLGPLRDEPRSLYPLQPTSDPQDVGLHGEHTAAVLHNFRHLDIAYLPSQAFLEKTIEGESVKATLEDAVVDWLTYLDVATRVDTSDEGKFGHGLSVYLAGGSARHDLTHVGVGVSQVLPIVVMCLLASRDTTVILEQPELHLNPRVQTRLADFFLSMALTGKQCLIETHSEYLINRLRFRSAAAPGKSLASLIKLYFVEKRESGATFRDVQINEYGAIVDWPKGFFDQGQREVEQILLAATEKVRAEFEE